MLGDTSVGHKLQEDAHGTLWVDVRNADKQSTEQAHSEDSSTQSIHDLQAGKS